MVGRVAIYKAFLLSIVLLMGCAGSRTGVEGPSEGESANGPEAVVDSVGADLKGNTKPTLSQVALETEISALMGAEVLAKKQAEAGTFVDEALSPAESIVPEYRLGYGDIIEVKFFGHENYNEVAPVRPDGRITLQKVGDIMAAGMTPSKVDTLVTEAYRQVLQKPDVTVIVRQFAPQQVYIFGEVNRPGGLMLQQNMTLLQGIAMAGGPNVSAKLNNVILLRPGLGEEGNGLIVNLEQYLSKKGLAIADPALLLKHQDVIYVPKTNFANVTEFLNQLYRGLLLPPIDMYWRILILRDRLF